MPSVVSKVTRAKVIQAKHAIAFLNLVLCLALALFLVLTLGACGFSPWPDRQAESVSGLATNAPTWAQGERRFVMPGDSVAVQIGGIRVGYACTHITEAGLVVSVEHSGAGVAAFEPLLKASMPGTPACPLQNTRDTIIGWKVAADAGIGLDLRLVDKEGNVGESRLCQEIRRHHLGAH
jgi:hypothetical protein